MHPSIAVQDVVVQAVFTVSIRTILVAEKYQRVGWLEGTFFLAARPALDGHRMVVSSAGVIHDDRVFEEGCVHVFVGFDDLDDEESTPEYFVRSLPSTNSRTTYSMSPTRMMSPHLSSSYCVRRAYRLHRWHHGVYLIVLLAVRCLLEEREQVDLRLYDLNVVVDKYYLQ